MLGSRRRRREAPVVPVHSLQPGAPARGFMHDSVSSSGTPSSTPRLITSSFRQLEERRRDLDRVSEP